MKWPLSIAEAPNFWQPDSAYIHLDSAEAAQTILDRIEQHRVVNWTQRDDIQNEMRNDLDDYLFDVVRDQKGYALTPAAMDDIIDRLMSIARARMPD
jgi:type I restriction enzyme R subunit